MVAEKLENPMGTKPILPLLLHRSFPLMLSLMTYSLCNVVDSIFVSRLSEDALTAISLAAPIQALIAALGLGIAVGLNATISRAMGEGDRAKVGEIASAAMVLAILGWLLISLVCLVGLNPYFAWQAGGNQRIRDAGTAYLRICMLLSLGQMAQWVFDRFLIATGRSSLFLVTLSTASIVNLILDPILIFGWLGFPALGTTGAAMASVIGQFSGAFAGIYINYKRNVEIPLRFTLRVSWRRMGEILRVGLPVAFMQGVFATSGILMNTIVQAFSSTAVAIMGMCTRLQALACIPVSGVNNALIPIVAFNYGAKNHPRIRESIRFALIISFALLGVVTLLLEILPIQILRLFDASENMLQIGVPAIRLLAIGYFLSVLGLVFSTSFQALGKSDFSMTLTLLRQVALPLGLVLLLSLAGNVTWVWLAFPLAEALSAPMALFFMRRVRETVLGAARDDEAAPRDGSPLWRLVIRKPEEGKMPRRVGEEPGTTGAVGQCDGVCGVAHDPEDIPRIVELDAGNGHIAFGARVGDEGRGRAQVIDLHPKEGAGEIAWGHVEGANEHVEAGLLDGEGIGSVIADAHHSDCAGHGDKPIGWDGLGTDVGVDKRL